MSWKISLSQFTNTNIILKLGWDHIYLLLFSLILFDKFRVFVKSAFYKQRLVVVIILFCEWKRVYSNNTFPTNSFCANFWKFIYWFTIQYCISLCYFELTSHILFRVIYFTQVEPSWLVQTTASQQLPATHEVLITREIRCCS